MQQLFVYLRNTIITCVYLQFYAFFSAIADEIYPEIFLGDISPAPTPPSFRGRLDPPYLTGVPIKSVCLSVRPSVPPSVHPSRPSPSDCDNSSLIVLFMPQEFFDFVSSQHLILMSLEKWRRPNFIKKIQISRL